MASQYQKIDDFIDICWDKESPVVLEKARLARDTYRGVNVLQLSFRNNCNSNLYELGISISMKDFNGRRVLKRDIEYNYYNMEIATGKTFGADEYITVESEAKTFQITVIRAEFSDGASFRGAALLKPMPYPLDPETLGEFQEPFTERIQAIRPKAKVICAPEDKLHFWRCICTQFYPHTVNKCPLCNLRKDEQLNILKNLKAEKKEQERLAAIAEMERLEAEERARQEAIELEKKRQQEEAERKRLKQQRIKKCCAYAATVVALLLLLFLVVPQFKKPHESKIPESSTTQQEIPESSVAPTPTPPPVAEPSVESTETIPEEPVFESTPLAILGQDLTDEDMKLVLRLIGMEETDFEQFDVIYVSSEEEINYLTGRYDNSLLGGRSLSSLLITPTEPGSGINVTTYNITYCTPEMYQELLLESGITDADVVVAAPFKMSGTAALAGIMKAGEYFEANALTEN